jgi:pyruvate dehydrogenase E2 component (dihydrolipoamide acetyltransferase)
MEFRLPDLGEGIDTATVTAVLVKPGDSVASGQNVIAIETDKAAMEVAADVAGKIEKVLVKPGDKIAPGAAVLSVSGDGKAAAKPSHAEARRETPPAEAKPAAPPSEKRQPASPPASSPTPAAPAAKERQADFKLPDLGEGIDSATVTSVLVKPGDSIAVGQNVIAIETDKASIEVPSDVAGTVEKILVKPGEKIPPGTRILTVGGAAKEQPAARAPAPEKSLPEEKRPESRPEPEARREPATAVATEERRAPARDISGNGVATKDGKLVPAGPATRRLARELGVGLAEVKPSGRGGRVTFEDVKSFVREERQRGGGGNREAATGFAQPPLPDFAKYGEIERKPVSSIRQTIARNLTIAWRTMPMVTQNDLADITELEAGRKRIVEAVPKGSPKITMTVLAVKACVAALREFPQFNSSFDMNAGEMIVKNYYHIGIAVDTERGLVVPVIRDAETKSIRDLAAEVTSLAEKARAGKLSLDEMRGGTFTITNLGGIGGTSFTPIINYPEVAILGLSRSSLQPVVRDGQIVPRLLMPLSLTYDHRVIDGADGARFTTRLVQLLGDPVRLLMET